MQLLIAVKFLFCLTVITPIRKKLLTNKIKIKSYHIFVQTNVQYYYSIKYIIR
jgi:hypothetical protein